MTMPSLTAIWLWLQAGNFELGWILAGMGALAAGIGIFRAGFAVGHSAGRVTETFEHFTQAHIDGQERLIVIGENLSKAVPAITQIQTGQQELQGSLLRFAENVERKIEMTDTSLAGMWEMVEERRKRSAIG